MDHCEDFFKVSQDKINNGCKKIGGWVGLRKLKIFLRTSLKRDTLLNRNDLKFFFTQFGIFLTDQDIDFIFSKHDPHARNGVDFYEVLNSFRVSKIRI